MTVTGHRADALMNALKIIHKAVEKELTGESTVEGMPDEKENRHQLHLILALSRTNPIPLATGTVSIPLYSLRR